MNSLSVLLDSNFLIHLTDQWRLKTEYWTDVRLEWGTRLRKSLGIAYPAERLARINCLFQKEEYSHLLEEVVCHELAHLVAYGRNIKSNAHHGKVWQKLMNEAGYEPRLGLSIENLQPRFLPPEQIVYLHSCQICHATRSSTKPNPSWKCINCVNAGFDGKVSIVSRPLSLGS